MNKITSLRFQKISFKNFRIHENKSFDLGDLTYITGDNFIGKTSIMHGICYALYGVSFFGQSNIDNLMRENTNNVEVSLVFSDQNNVPHTLTRTRRGSQTGIVLDSRSIRQEDIIQMLCSKDLFLSMFNPSYLPELGLEARDLLESVLPPIPNESILEQISEQERNSLAGRVISDPVLMLKDCRTSLKALTTEKTRLGGQIDFLKDTKKTTDQKLLTVEAELQRTQAAIQKLKSRQFEGIDYAGLQSWLTQAEQMKNGEAYCNADREIQMLSEKIQQRESQQYVSSYQYHLAEYDAQLKVLANQCKGLQKQMESLKPGDCCPNCMTVMTEQSLSVMRNKLSAKYSGMIQQGNQLMAQKKEILDYEQKEKEKFIQFQKEDLARMSLQLQQIKESCQFFPDITELKNQMAEAKRILQYGNLSDDQINELNCLEATLSPLRMELDTLRAQDNTQKLKELVDQLAGIDIKREEEQNRITALTSFIAKRSELSTRPLELPNVKIKLTEVARSTGELKNVFKFIYKGRNYASLSLSEKILAGLELSSALRKLSGIDCPVCVDNKESIGSFGKASMPSQIIMLQFIKGKELSVNFRNTMEDQSLRKAS